MALLFCLGVIIADWLRTPFLYSYCLAALLLVFSLLFFRNTRLSGAITFGLAFLLGMAALSGSDKKAADCVEKYLYKGSGPHIARGVILNNPLVTDGKTTFLFRLKEIESNSLKHSCSGDILVAAAYADSLNYGEELILAGNIFRSRFCAEGASAMMRVRAPVQVIKLGGNKGLKIRALAFWLKKRLTRLISEYFSAIPAGVVEAMVLGEKRNIPRPIYDSMIKSGTVHILVVSGFNTGIIAGIIVLLLKVLRLPRRVRIIAAGFLLVIYCFMAGASTPVVRATVMSLVFMSAYFFKRDPDIYNSLALAAIFILALNPRQLFNIGFQLSFISVFSIACFYPRLSAFLRTEALKIRLFKLAIEAMLVSFSAWLGTAGIIAYYFKIFSPVTVFANLFIVPLSSLVTLCGFSTLIAASLCPAAARLFSITTELLVMLLLSINSWLVKLPAAYFYLPGRS